MPFTGLSRKKALLEFTDAEWHAEFDLFVLPVLRMARIVTPVMERQGGGAIVNISSFVAAEPNIDFPVVICADCLDHAGDVLNLALRH